MRVLRAGAIAAALAAVLLATGNAVLARGMGIYKDHYGIYTTRPRRAVLPWHQPGTVPSPAEPARAARSMPSNSPLPWKGGTPRATSAVVTGLVRVPTGQTWSTYPYLYPYGTRWPVYVSPTWSGALGGYARGVWGWWGYGTRFGGQGFVFSTRYGLAGYRHGRLGFSVRW